MASDENDSWAKLAVAAGAVLAITLLACSTAELSKKGADVVTSQSAPSDSGYDPNLCKHRGYVVGKGGGAFGGAWISNESLVEYAMNDLRNKAAKLGANFVQHDAPQMGVAGDGNGTNTTTATISGNAYFCSGQKGSAVAVQPTPRASAAVPARPLPEGVAGFRLDGTVEQAKSICEGAGFQFTASDAVAKCSSSVVDLQAPSEVQLSFCGDKTCKIEVTLLPPAEKLDKFMQALSKQLSSRYGEKTANRTDLKQCPNASELAQCVLRGTASVEHEWSWPSKHAVQMTSGRAKDQACVILSYLTPDFKQTLAPGPAL